MANGTTLTSAGIAGAQKAAGTQETFDQATMDWLDSDDGRRFLGLPTKAEEIAKAQKWAATETGAKFLSGINQQGASMPAGGAGGIGKDFKWGTGADAVASDVGGVSSGLTSGGIQAAINKAAAGATGSGSGGPVSGVGGSSGSGYAAADLQAMGIDPAALADAVASDVGISSGLTSGGLQAAIDKVNAGAKGSGSGSPVSGVGGSSSLGYQLDPGAKTVPDLGSSSLGYQLDPGAKTVADVPASVDVPASADDLALEHFESEAERIESETEDADAQAAADAAAAQAAADQAAADVQTAADAQAAADAQVAADAAAADAQAAADAAAAQAAANQVAADAAAAAEAEAAAQVQIEQTFNTVLEQQQAVYEDYLAQEEAEIDDLLNRGIIGIDEAESAYNESAEKFYNSFLDDQESIMAEFEQMLVNSQTQTGMDRESLRNELGAAGIDYGLVAQDMDFLDRQAAQTQGAQGDYLSNLGRIGEESQYDRQLAGERLFGGARAQAGQAATQEKYTMGRESREQQRALEQMAVSAEQLADTVGVDKDELLSAMIAGIDLPGMMESRRAQEAQIGESQRAQEADIAESGRQFDHRHALDLSVFTQGQTEFNSLLQLDQDKFEQRKSEYGIDAALRQDSFDRGKYEWSRELKWDKDRHGEEMSQRDTDRQQRIAEFDQGVTEFNLNYGLDLDAAEVENLYRAELVSIDRDRLTQDLDKFNIGTEMWSEEMAENARIEANRLRAQTASTGDREEILSMEGLAADEEKYGVLMRLRDAANVARRDRWLAENPDNHEDDWVDNNEVRDTITEVIQDVSVWFDAFQDVDLADPEGVDEQFKALSDLPIDYSDLFGIEIDVDAKTMEITYDVDSQGYQDLMLFSNLWNTYSMQGGEEPTPAQVDDYVPITSAQLEDMLISMPAGSSYADAMDALGPSASDRISAPHGSSWERP